MQSTLIETDLLPPSARELAEVIGLDATLALIEHYGGTRLYVPEHIGADHPLARAIGMQAAHTLVEHYARDSIDVPRAWRAARAVLYRQIVAAYTDGATAASLARRHRCTERWIYEIVARHRAEAASLQQSLL